MPLANSEECRAYYRSLRNLARYYEDTNNQWQFKLRPGKYYKPFLCHTLFAKEL